MGSFEYTLSGCIGVVIVLAFYNPFGFWEYLCLLGIGVILAASISLTLIFLIKRISVLK